MPTQPQHLIERVEATTPLPAGSEERFSGYGVMGLPFTSGHILAMRRFPSSSLGPGYTSVWHRRPVGDWEFYATVPPSESCTRYFGEAAARAIETEILIRWLEPDRFVVVMPAVSFEWEISLASTAATRLMNIAGRVLPSFAWRNEAVLSTMGLMANPLLGVERIGLHGRVPNGQRFVANPRVLWSVVESRAHLAQEDFGTPGAVHPQAHLGDFWIPQRGILAIGQAYFDPYDPARHSAKTSRS